VPESPDSDQPADEADAARNDSAARGASARPALRLDGEPQVSVGEEFAVTLHVDNATGFATLRSVLRFDPSVVQFTGGEAGDLVPEALRAAGAPRAEAGGGRVRVELQGSNLTGNGSLAIMRFRALAPRPQTMISLQQFAATNGANQGISIMAPRPVVMAVTP
jgi:hypothetical protein